MIHRSSRRLTSVYLQLVLLACFAVLLSGLARGRLLALVAIFAIVVLKARLIVLDFLGMREWRRPMRVALLLWPFLFAVVAVARAVLVGTLAAG